MFQVSEISFCDKKALNIKSDDFKKYILEQLNSLYNVNIMNRHYEVLNAKNIIHLQNNPYVISLKSLEGNSYYLYCLRHNDVNTCIFIDRKVCKGYSYPRMICIKYLFDDCVFNNTLFEGEMIKYDDKKWTFIINDIISYNNSHLTNVNLIKRLSTLNTILTDHYKPDDILDVCKLQIKRYFGYSEYDTVLESFIPSLSYKTKGLIFKSIHLKFPSYLYVFDEKTRENIENNSKLRNISTQNNTQNTNNTNTNTNTNTHNTQNTNTNTNHIPLNKLDITMDIELKIVKGDKPDTYYLYTLDNDEKIGLVGIPNLKISKWIQNLLREKREDKVRCKYNDIFKKWVPIME
jgi:hypothetical protein